MTSKVETKCIDSLSELVSAVSELQLNDENFLVFRGEKKKYDTPLAPNVYRDPNFLKNEHVVFRECQRFNDQEFRDDRTAFDKLSRMQHHSALTRIIDVSQELWSAVYFAIEKNDDKCEDAIVYVLEINKEKVKYYDSDAVSVISNLAKLPLESKNQKSKASLLKAVNDDAGKRTDFNDLNAVKFLLHEIKEEKPYFEPIIDPKHITSVQFVWPKLTSSRIRSQKGAFLLFGLHPDGAEKQIKLIDNDELLDDEKIDHPIERIHKLVLKNCYLGEMRKDLEKMGICKPFIYPEIDKVSEYLQDKYKG